MPYASLKDAPASWKKIGGVALSLSQVNWIARIYDRLIEKGMDKGKAAGTAINMFKKVYKIKGGKWVKREKREDIVMSDFIEYGQHLLDVEIDENLLTEAEKSAREKAKDAQKKRAAKYGIGIKPGGNVTKPSKYSDVADDDFLDPVNYRYPADSAHLKPALVYFNQTEHKTQGGYTDDEWAKMGRKLARKLGDQYQYDTKSQTVVKKKQKREQIEGGLEEFREKLRGAISDKMGKGVYLKDIVDNFAIVDQWDENTMKSHYYKIAFSFDDNGKIILGEPVEIEIKEVIKPIQQTEETEDFDPEKFVIEESVETDAGAETGTIFNVTGKILLEEKKDGKEPFVRGKVPMIKFNKFTENGNRYFEECWKWLDEDIKRLKESKSSRKVLDMYPTHRPALDPKSPDYFMLRAGKITGVSQKDDIGYIHFETLNTEAGRTMAVQLLEGMVDGVSLRAYPKPGFYEPNERGGDDVKRLILKGADFTDVGAMPFNEEEKGFQLEEVENMNLEELKQKNPEAYKKLMEEAAKSEAEKAKKIEEENRKLKEKLAAEEKERRKTTLIEHAQKIINDVKDFGDVVKKNVLEEVKAQLEQIMQEHSDDDVAKIKIEELIKKKFELKKEEIAEALKLTMKQQKQFVADPNVISTLTTEARKVGLTEEMTGGSTRIRDLILAKVFKRPVYKDGQFLLEEWEDRLNPLIEKQLYYMNYVGKNQNDLLAVGGRLYNMLLTEEMQREVAPLLEAGEATTSGVVGSNLPTEVAAALIYAAWPDTIAMQIAVTGDMQSSTKDIFEVGYPTSDTEVFRRGKHIFGWVDHAAATTLKTSGSGLATTDYGDGVDDGALSTASNEYPESLYAVLVEAPNDSMTVTWTGTDENGDTATWTVTFASTDAAGTIKRCTPANVGQKCTDVTAVSATSGLTSGQVMAFVEKPITGATAGSAEDKAYLGITKSQATADDYDLGARIDISLIEDMQLAMKDKGGGLDYLALIVATLKKAIVDQIDRKILYEVVDDADGGSQTFAQSSPESGYTQAEWNKRFLYYCDLVVDETAITGNFEPNWMVWSRADRSRFMDWLAEGWTKYNVQRNELHLNSRAIGNVSGCEVLVSPNARRSRVAVGTNQTGVHYYVYVPFVILGPQWVPDTKTKAVMVHHRAAFKVTQAKTLGKLVIS